MMTMPRNGVAYEDAREKPIDMGDFLPERREVKLNGKTYQAWVATNLRYPRRIQARLSQARDKYLRASAPIREWRVPPKEEVPDGQAIPLPIEVALAMGEADVAYQEWMTVALTELIPGLRVEEAEIIGVAEVQRLLGPEPEGLGYLAPLESDGENPDETEEGEGEEQDASPLTGTTPTPNSPVDTLPTP